MKSIVLISLKLMADSYENLGTRNLSVCHKFSCFRKTGLQKETLVRSYDGQIGPECRSG